MGCSAVWSDRSLQTFQRSLLPPSSGQCVFYQTTRRYKPEDNYLHVHRRENLKSHFTNLKINFRKFLGYNAVYDVGIYQHFRLTYHLLLRGINSWRQLLYYQAMHTYPNLFFVPAFFQFVPCTPTYGDFNTSWIQQIVRSRGCTSWLSHQTSVVIKWTKQM
jgi:hypothetical protein